MKKISRTEKEEILELRKIERESFDIINKRFADDKKALQDASTKVSNGDNNAFKGLSSKVLLIMLLREYQRLRYYTSSATTSEDLKMINSIEAEFTKRGVKFWEEVIYDNPTEAVEKWNRFKKP